MLSHDLLARLGQLNQQRSVAVASHATRTPPAVRGPRTTTELPAGREVENAWGRHWLAEQELASLWPEGEERLKRSRPRAPQAEEAAGRLHDELRLLVDEFPTGAVLLDLETCGFAGSMVFLVGVLHYRGGRWTLWQLLARHYAEEKAMLQTFWRLAADKRVLVTFNGKSFDWPMVQDRSTLHHLGRDPRMPPAANPPPQPVDRDVFTEAQPRPTLVHCDLLHHARRRWKHRLPNCKLQTLEQFVCGRRRSGDIPGRDIPQAYQDFVRDGDAWPIRSILHHNALDLVTLLQLSLVLMAQRSTS